MRFDRDYVEKAVAGLHGAPTTEKLAWWQNYRFEQRVAPGRRGHFEGALPADVTPDTLQEWHNTYITNHVNLPVGTRLESRPFQAGNDDAALAAPHGSEKLVRVEDLSDWCRDIFKGSQSDLEQAFRNKDATFEKFLQEMNVRRGPRPMFAALWSDLDGTVPGWRARWHEVLPRVLGLGHLDADRDGGGRVLALMIYSPDRVAAAPAAAQRFAAPTTLDLCLNKCFMPSPFPTPKRGVSYGHAVNLDGQGTLVCEMIHRHIVYELDDVKDVTVIKVPVTRMDPVQARQTHLDRLRAEPDCAGFGSDSNP